MNKSEQKRDQVLKLHKQKWSPRQIAQKTGLKRTEVIRIIENKKAGKIRLTFTPQSDIFSAVGLKSTFCLVADLSNQFISFGPRLTMVAESRGVLFLT